PAAFAVTSPLWLTVATEALPLDHVIARPASGLPPASCGVAVSCVVWPTCRLADVGLTVTDATGTGGCPVTVTAALPLCPPLVAVIVADPVATPVTSPLLFTVAIPGLLLDQLIVQPVSTLPLESSAFAVSCTVWPGATLGAG